MPLKMELVFAALLLACLHHLVLSNLQGDALYQLKLSLGAPANQLIDWNPSHVDPCTWSNVICDNNDQVTSVTLSGMNCSGTLSSKIGILNTLTTLTLKGNGITGEIPKEFGNLSSLSSLDLGNNRLSGEIPSSLGDLKRLQFLTLSQNNLTGAIPESLSRLQNLINILLDSNHLSGHIPEHLFQIPKYNFTGNRLNCGANFPQPCESDNSDSGASNKPKIGIIVGIVGGTIILLLFVGLLFFVCKGRHKGYKHDMFEDVAGGDAAFQREVEMISVAVHRNLLRLIGFCTTPSERLLVYPFMPNLSVAYRLRDVANFTYFCKHMVNMLTIMVKKLEREKRLDDIVDCNLNEHYNIQEVEMMIQVALLCTQASPEDRPAMSEVVRMLEGEGLAERWEEWQHVEDTRRQEYERLQRRFEWGDDSSYNQLAIELSGGR
ncbi:hypothetical protein GH714_035552 [Hevea brasiliensis]|uniref:Leucine-rich repeat-containing N-terminal plant-type domain-containing protein n=1 Tax=Hevea brasiliensis TaxID=3981 RepID=A0A6A6KYE0_HEVBR|nr:hypothetical protein GH714_035552 [Hevea brasiliensis]